MLYFGRVRRQICLENKVTISEHKLNKQTNKKLIKILSNLSHIQVKHLFKETKYPLQNTVYGTV